MMKVAVSHDHLNVRVEERDVPEPGAGEMRVRIKLCGVCTSDTLGWYVKQKAPVVLGHEPVAVVDKPGEGVTSFQSGQRVFVHHHAPCGTCRFCLREKYVLCPTWRKQALVPGGFSEQALVRPQSVEQDSFLLPEDMPDEAAVFIEPLACSVHAFRAARMRPDDRVAIIGMGVMGFINAYTARAMGVREIAVADLMPERLKMAEEHELGEVVDGNRSDADQALRDALGGQGGDVVIVGPGNLPAMELGMAATAPGGTLVLFTPGPAEETLAINPFRMYFKDITVTTSYSCDPVDTRKALELIRGGHLPHERLITHRFTLEGTEEALKTLAAGGKALKVLIYVDPEIRV